MKMGAIFNILVITGLLLMIACFSIHAMLWGRIMRNDNAFYEGEGRPFVFQLNYWKEFYITGKYELLCDEPSKNIARVISKLIVLDRKVLLYSIPVSLFVFVFAVFTYATIT
jgi:hypothetical protein